MIPELLVTALVIAFVVVARGGDVPVDDRLGPGRAVARGGTEHRA